MSEKIKTVEINDITYYQFSEICKIAGRKNVSGAAKSLNPEYVIKVKVMDASNKFNHSLYVTKNGVLEFLAKARSDIFVKKEILKELKIDPDTYLIHTPSEMIFKKYLKNICDTLGVLLLYQYQLFDWRVDFYIPSKKLVIQYDETNFHNIENIYLNDIEQDEFLEQEGYSVLRVAEDCEGAGILNILKVLSNP